jgi:hypothetical protein
MEHNIYCAVWLGHVLGTAELVKFCVMVFCYVYDNAFYVQVAVVDGMTLLVGERMNLVIGIQIKGEEFLGEAADMEVEVLRIWETTGNWFCF